MNAKRHIHIRTKKRDDFVTEKASFKTFRRNPAGVIHIYFNLGLSSSGDSRVNMSTGLASLVKRSDIT